MILLAICGGKSMALLGWGGSWAVDFVAECLDEWIDESNPVRAVDAFVDALDLGKLGSKALCRK
jgi:hypothetical protein